MKKIKCPTCKKVFTQSFNQYHYKKYNNPNGKNYCSSECVNNAKRNSTIFNCSNCGKKVKRTQGEINKNKSGNFFCTSSCAATYNNTHRSFGYRRSKLEVYLEERLTDLYPNLDIKFNEKEAINSELDIYIPFLKLAIELNGIFHYEPIYGEDKLEQIQNNDNRKFQACLERNIEFCIIDTSGQIRFTEKSSQKYLDIIIKILNDKLLLHRN